MEDKLIESLQRLIETVKTLRKKCPWDAEQTPESLRPLTIEEAYELSQSIIKQDVNDERKELGDLLLHIITYSIIAEERQQFNLKDVVDTLYDKLIFRHPHVFGDFKAETPEEVSKMWEQVKLKEKGGNKTVLGGIPTAMPSLLKAYRITDKAHGVGFDWESRDEVWKTVAEEIEEFEREVLKGNPDKMEDEFGDVLFVLANAARLYGINPDTALERSNAKFIYRFNYIEQKAKEQGKNLKDMTLKEMDVLWEEAKNFASEVN